MQQAICHKISYFTPKWEKMHNDNKRSHIVNNNMMKHFSGKQFSLSEACWRMRRWIIRIYQSYLTACLSIIGKMTEQVHCIQWQHYREHLQGWEQVRHVSCTPNIEPSWGHLQFLSGTSFFYFSFHENNTKNNNGLCFL